MSLAILPSSSSTHGLFSAACVVYQCEHGGEPSMLGIEHLVFPMESGKWALPVCVKAIEFALLLGFCCPCFVSASIGGAKLCVLEIIVDRRETHAVIIALCKEGTGKGSLNIAPQSTIIRLSTTSRWRFNFSH